MRLNDGWRHPKGGRAMARHTGTLDHGQRGGLLQTLQKRFDANTGRHKSIAWKAVLARLDAVPDKVWSLSEMERTGGEPDVIAIDKATGVVVFCDCSPESPAGRRNLCYDRAALVSRKEHRPAGSVMDMAADMGIEVLDEKQYRTLQELGTFDTRTQSWITTPLDIRELGGALFCDRRYGHVFVYHNGAESYYAARGFRGLLRV